MTFHSSRAYWVGFSGLLAMACGAGREVAVSGDVAAASTIAVEGPVRLELYDVLGSGEDRELTLVHSVTLDELGAFNEEADFEGERLVVRAIDDRDENGACSAGEAWGQVETAISEDGKAEPVAIQLGLAACPAAD